MFSVQSDSQWCNKMESDTHATQPSDIKAWGRTLAAFLFLPPLPLLILALGEERENPTSALTSSPLCYADQKDLSAMQILYN